METENTLLLQLFFPTLLKILSEFGYRYFWTYFEDEEISVRLVKYAVVIVRPCVAFACISLRFKGRTLLVYITSASWIYSLNLRLVPSLCSRNPDFV